LFFFTIGVFLCFAIVYTNLAVIKALCMKDSPHNKHNVLMRRISRGSSLTCNATTKEERAFGWLMFLLCVAFVTCWVPQMVNATASYFKYYTYRYYDVAFKIYLWLATLQYIIGLYICSAKMGCENIVYKLA